MIRVNKSVGYALLAVGYIARRQGAEGVVLAQAVSTKYGIPLEYLLKILQQLARANVLHSKRGPQGGFWMAKPANRITMLEIIEAVDGPLTGELNLTKQARNDKYSAKVEQTYIRAISQARNVCEKACRVRLELTLLRVKRSAHHAYLPEASHKMRTNFRGQDQATVRVDLLVPIDSYTFAVEKRASFARRCPIRSRADRGSTSSPQYLLPFRLDARLACPVTSRLLPVED